MRQALRALLMLALVAALVVSTASAMVTSHGPALISVLRVPRNVTRVDQGVFVKCVRNCSTSHTTEVKFCNAQGSEFRSMRLKNMTAARKSSATVGVCVSAASQRLRDCKRKCRP